MTKAPDPSNDRALMESALLEIRRLRKELQAATDRPNPAIAVIGIGCRLPGGVNDAESYWEVLSKGIDTVGEIPPQRFDLESLFDPEPGATGKTYCRHGAFLEDIDLFDPAFFGISPREAAGLDPQQRLLLEVAWEALEDAAIDPQTLTGSSTGVFTGLFMDDYSRLGFASGDPSRVDAYNCLGSLRSLAAGRLSYALGLRGPSMQLDTACSSSLVAVHLACLHLQAAQCDLALAGGANLILSAESTLGVSQLRGLSATGRCSTFDAAADGYVRGEGCSLVVLKRLEEALDHGDPIHAVIRGSAINHDGRSNGLTAPSGSAQEAVIRAALDAAQISPEEVPFVETHGTGTLLGDPIEATALGNVLGKDRSADNPLWLGASKTNFGHLEAAAGTTALIKAILAVGHRQIPPNLHFSTPNPHIAWEDHSLAVPTRLTPWPAGKRTIAGVSSFGMSGTNAHTVIEDAPTPQTPSAAPGTWPFCLSARSSAELRALARRHGEFLQRRSTLPLAGVCATAAMGRQDFSHRLALGASTVANLAKRLLDENTTRDESSSDTRSSESNQGRAHQPKVAFLFTGQGSHASDFGRSLYREGGEFQAAFDRCSKLFEPHLGLSLVEVLDFPASSTTEATAATSPTVAQAALFTLQTALTSQWRAWGVEPAIVLGYSFGEISAAWAAGVFSLQTAVEMVAKRAQLVSELPAAGAMAVVDLAEQELRAALEGPGQVPGVEIAAILGTNQTVVSGAKASLEELSRWAQGQGVKYRQLPVSQAFHSSLLDPMLAPFGQVMDSLDLRTPQLPLISNVSGQLAGAETATPRYWQQQLREPIHWTRCLDTLGQALSGPETVLLLEIGPQPALLGLAARHGATASFPRLPSLRQRRNGRTQMVESLGQYWVAGGTVSWEQVFGATPQRLHLPTYPFQRQRHWLPEPPRKAVSSQPIAKGPTRQNHPAADATTSLSANPVGSQPRSASTSKLGRRLLLPGLRETIFESCYSLAHRPELAHHRLRGKIVVAGAYWISVLWEAAQNLGWRAFALEDVLFAQPLWLEGLEARTVHLILRPPGSRTPESATGSWEFEVISFPSSRNEDTAVGDTAPQPPLLHVTGRLVEEPEKTTSARTGEGLDEALDEALGILDLEAIQNRCQQTLSSDEHYSRQQASHLSLAPNLRWLSRAWVGSGESLARLSPPPAAPPLAAPPLAAQSEGNVPLGGPTERTAPVRAMPPSPEDPTTGWLDSCFQTLAAALGTSDDQQGVPFRVGSLKIRSQLQDIEPRWCHARLQRAGSDPSQDGAGGKDRGGSSLCKGDLWLADASNRVRLQIEGLEIRSIPTKPAPSALSATPGSAEMPALPLYRWAWHPAPTASLPPAVPSDDITWLISSSRSNLEVTVLEDTVLEDTVLEDTVRKLPISANLRTLQSKYPNTRWIDGSDFSNQFLQQKERGQLPARILFLSFGETTKGSRKPPPQAALEACCQLLELVQTLTRHTSKVLPRITVITRGAQSVGDDQHEIDPAQSAIWGLAAVVAREHPELRCQCIDLGIEPSLDRDSQADLDSNPQLDRQESFETLEAALALEAPESRIALRRGAIYLGRLVEATARAAELPWQPEKDGTLLITGGLGGLGLEIARWWIGQGGRNLLLTGRREKPSQDQESPLEDLRRAGANVHYRPCDVSDPKSVDALESSLESSLAADLPGLIGVVHAAGVMDDGILLHQTPERFQKIFSAKVEGSWNLHQLTLRHPASIFLCCSSAASLLGTPGQGAYAAANAFLDGLCHLRSSHGQASLSVNWGPWQGRGMAASSSASVRKRWQTQGVTPLTPAEALQPLAGLLGCGETQALVMRVDWNTFSRQSRPLAKANQDSSALSIPFLAELAELTELAEPAKLAPDNPKTSPRLRRQLALLPQKEGRRLLAAGLRDALCAISGLGANQVVGGNENLFELGLDSLMAIDLRSRLENDLGLSLPTTFVFDNPSLAEIEAELLPVVFPPPPEQMPAPEESLETPTPKTAKGITKQITPIDHLQEEEAEALLLEELQRLNS